MTYEIRVCSPDAQKLINSYDDAIGIEHSTSKLTKYPFGSLTIGQCFTIPINEANEFSLRQCSYRAGAKLKKKFAVIKHKDFACIEVARIA